MDWYREHLLDTGRSAATWAIIAFLVTFAITRGITRRIRARQTVARTAGRPVPDTDAPHDDGGGLKDIYIGGVHVHHQVWGILLVLITGLLFMRFTPSPPWSEILGTLFGVGAALTLDEFALWFHLDDVYWGEEGRKSVDAILIGAAVATALLLQATPVGPSGQGVIAQYGVWLYIVLVSGHLAIAVICFLKGKLATGLIGIVVPIVATVGAIRLARPDSVWARHRYGAAKLARSRRRFGAAYHSRRDRLRDLVGGGPTARSGGG